MEVDRPSELVRCPSIDKEKPDANTAVLVCQAAGVFLRWRKASEDCFAKGWYRQSECERSLEQAQKDG